MCQTMGTTAEDTGSRLSCEAPFAGGVMATRHRPVNSRPALSTACPDWRLPLRIFPAPERRADPPATGGARPHIGGPGSGGSGAGERTAVNAGDGGRPDPHRQCRCRRRLDHSRQCRRRRCSDPIGNAGDGGAWARIGSNEDAGGAGLGRPQKAALLSKVVPMMVQVTSGMVTSPVNWTCGKLPPDRR